MEISKALYDEVKSCANIISGDEYKKLFCTIAKVVSDVVSQTLGPYGSTTIIDDGSGFTYPTKDGWSCMNRLRFNDPVYNTIFGIIKQVSFNSVSTVGDGTTTAMVATSAFLEYLYDNMIPNLEAQHLYNQSNIVYTMNQVTDEIAKKLRENSNVKHIDPDGDFSDINRIAYIATNGNYKFAKMIQEIYQKTKNPNIRIEIDNGAPETTYQIEKGYRFDCKPIAFNSYINDETGIIRKDDKPFKVIIFDHNVTYQMHKQLITSISQLASMRNTEYVILAPYFDDIVCSIIQNSAAQMIRQGSYPNVMLVQIPTSLNMHQLAITDLSVLSNSLIFTETLVKVFNTMVHNQTCDPSDVVNDPIMELPQYAKYQHPQEILEDCSGTVKSAIFEANEGFIQDYETVCNKDRYEKLVHEVKESYEIKKAKAIKTINGLLDKDFLFTQLRYIKLMGNSGIIKVGGMSDIQKRCDKDSLDDAILACRSAFENGYVRGMCLEIIKLTTDTLNDKNNQLDPFEEEVYKAIQYSFTSVFKKVLFNKFGGDTERVNSDYILSVCLKDNSVYDLRDGYYHGSKDWTVINSVQTDIEILLAMTNILTTIMTSTQFLSTNRSCDLKVSREKALEQRVADESAIAAGKMKGMIDAIGESRFKDGVSIGIYPVNGIISEDEETGIQHVYDTCCDPGFYQETPSTSDNK